MESRGEASFAALPNPHNIKGGLNVFHRHFPDILLKTFVKLKWEDTHILAGTHCLVAGCHSLQTSKYSPEVVNPCHRVGPHSASTNCECSAACPANDSGRCGRRIARRIAHVGDIIAVAAALSVRQLAVHRSNGRMRAIGRAKTGYSRGHSHFTFLARNTTTSYAKLKEMTPSKNDPVSKEERMNATKRRRWRS